MKTAFLILAHRNSLQVGRLVNSLAAPGNFFIIHVDARTDPEEFSWLKRMENVHLTNSFQINWGGWNMVAATLRLLETGRKLGCDRFHLLSGQDYPLVGNEELARSFDNDLNFMSLFQLPCSSWDGGGMTRHQLLHFVDLLAGAPPLVRHVVQRLLRGLGSVFRRKMPYGFIPYGGAQWWSVTSEAVDLVLERCTTHTHLIPFFKKTLIPDETFFQTVIMNSSLSQKVVTDNRRFTLWERTNPATLTMAHLEQLLTSGKSFGRKFDIALDAKVFDALDQHRTKAVAVGDA